jgi:hypothetical protein
VRRFPRELFALFLAVLIVSIGAPQRVQAQVDTLRRDTARVVVVDTPPVVLDSVTRDSLRADSLRAEGIRKRAERAADTVKAPIAQYPTGPDTEILRARRWTREELLATGAINIADLLEDVPGLTTYRTSWFPGVHAAAYQGDFRRLRVFMDGLELDAPDPRNNGVLDLTEISLASLDEVVVERAAGEVRVWLTTWTVRSVTPYTRTDIYTGDLNTNGFRGLFGRRFMNGALFQLTMQQGETARQRGNLFSGGARGLTGDGDIRQLTARVGWSRGLLSIDGYIANTSRTRDSTEGDEDLFTIPEYDGSRTDSYLRFGYGSTTKGWSAQALLGNIRSKPRVPETTEEEPQFGEPENEEEEPEEPLPDSSRSITQRVLHGGYAWDRTRVGAFARWRTIDGNTDLSPGFVASTDRGWLTASLRGERIGLDSSRRVDANVRLRLRPWFTTTFAHSDLAPDDTTGRLGEQTSRAEAAIRLRGRWLSAGFIRHAFDEGTRNVIIPRLLTPYDTAVTAQLLGFTGNGITFGAQAPLYKDIRLELHGTRWAEDREYRPRTQVRASLILQSEWRSRFPAGHFSINARLMHEYRSAVSFLEPTQLATGDLFRTGEPYNLGMALLEIRILRATLFYQFRNVYGTLYQQVPGVLMPPPFQTYGVRWEWFN